MDDENAIHALRRPYESTKQGQRIWLADLPSEVLAHTIAFLDSTCPSERKFIARPDRSLTDSPVHCLKNVSFVSRRLRRLALPLLYSNARLDPYRLSDFLSFVQANNLTPHVKSVVAILQGPCNHLHPAWWARLLNDVPLTTFTILAAPHIFAEIACVSVSSGDTWAFNMPYHTIRFRQDAHSVKERISLNRLPSLLACRQWTDFSVNEGSSLKAYQTYEYFLRRTPSLMATLHHAKSVEADVMFSELTSFSFTAIFPFYNHVDEILKSVRKMRKLRILSMKICPEPDSTVLEDEINEARGHIDVNDPWNEFDIAYTLTAHTVIFLTVEGELQELRVDDVKMEGIRENLEKQLTSRLQEWWDYGGNGVWTRNQKPALPRAAPDPPA